MFQGLRAFAIPVQLHWKKPAVCSSLGAAGAGASSGRTCATALPEWQVEEQLDQPDQVAAATAPRAVEQVLTDLDVDPKAVFPAVRDSPTSSCRWPARRLTPVLQPRRMNILPRRRNLWGCH
jgi:hypothetical protein